MNWLTTRMRLSPMFARTAPFLIFLALTALQDVCGTGAGRYWLYAAKTLVGAWMIWAARPFVAEMRWEWSGLSVFAGAAVAALWVGLDPYYPHWTTASAAKYWNPARDLGAAAGWSIVGIRLVGSAFIVPPLEEVFYRSFLYRFIAGNDWQNKPLNQFLPMPFFVTSLIFGLAHSQWLAGILCGLTFQWLVLRKGRIGEAMAAHAVANLLLGLWVVWRGAWQFW